MRTLTRSFVLNLGARGSSMLSKAILQDSGQRAVQGDTNACYYLAVVRLIDMATSCHRIMSIGICMSVKEVMQVLNLALLS